MNALAIIVTYFLTWWIVIFLVVPRSNDRAQKGGLYPDNPRLMQKIIVTSVISALITLAIWGVVRLDVIDFRQWAEQWDQ